MCVTRRVEQTRLGQLRLDRPAPFLLTHWRERPWTVAWRSSRVTLQPPRRVWRNKPARSCLDALWPSVCSAVSVAAVTKTYLQNGSPRYSATVHSQCAETTAEARQTFAISG